MTQPQFEQIPVTHPALDRLVTEFGQVYVNGGAVLACFALVGGRSADWLGHSYSTRGRGSWCYGAGFPADDAERLKTFLTSRAVAAALEPAAWLQDAGEFPDILPSDPALINPELTYLDSLVLDGHIALTLLGPGAYQAFRGTAAEAKELGRAAYDAMFGSRYEDVWVYTSGKAWCPWFFNVNWDFTWIMIDDRENKLWLLCVTDTD